MGHVCGSGAPGGVAFAERGVGVADRGDDAAPFQFGGELRGSVQLGREAPPCEVRTAVQNFAVLLGARVAEVAAVLRPGELRIEVGAFEVHAAKGGSVAVFEPRLAVGLERFVERFVRAGQRRGVEECRAVLRVHAGCREVGLDGSVHEVGAAGPVGVHVDESRGDVAPLGVDDRGPGRNHVVDAFDPVVLEEQHTVPDASGGQDSAVDNSCYHFSILYP